jgi:hypothetical protein
MTITERIVTRLLLFLTWMGLLTRTCVVYNSPIKKQLMYYLRCCDLKVGDKLYLDTTQYIVTSLDPKFILERQEHDKTNP